MSQAKKSSLPLPIIPEPSPRSHSESPERIEGTSPFSTSYGEHTNWHKYDSLNSPGHHSLILGATPPKMKGRARKKSNSTNHPFLASTLTAPDTNEIVKCIAQTIHCATYEGHKNPSLVHDSVWSEEFQPLDNNSKAWTSVPTQESIEHLLLHIFQHTVMSSECCVMALVYLDRLIELTGVVVQPKNWRRLLLGALIVASKVWEDDAVWNEDFLQPFPYMKISDLGDLERYYLNGLQFSVTLKPSVYAEYYFRLSALSTKRQLNFQPLDEESAEKLYKRSKGLEDRSRPQPTSPYHQKRLSAAHRSTSHDSFTPLPITLSTEQIQFPKKAESQ